MSNKLSEILSGYLPGVDTAGWMPAELVTAIKARYASRHGDRLTNHRSDGVTGLSWGECRPTFVYKRDHLKLNGPPSLLKFFGIHSESSKHVAPFLLNSGQAAINVALQVARTHFRLSTVVPVGSLYVGARELQEIENFRIGSLDATAPEAALLWICSSDLSEQQRRKFMAAAHCYKFFVIDTTCWSLGSPVISELLEHLKDIPGVLIRSHSKLDMGGIEYGSLGSIVAVSSRTDELVELENVTEKIIRLTGSVPSVDDVPPYFFNLEFWSFLDSRCKAMTETTDELKKNEWEFPAGVRMRFPEHGRYFFIFFSTARFPNQERNFENLLHKCLQLKEVPHYFMPSFGFDDCVVSAFQSSDVHGEFIVRISPGIGEGRGTLVGEAVAEFLKLVETSHRGSSAS